jgi:hypothetical protein
MKEEGKSERDRHNREKERLVRKKERESVKRGERKR